MMRRRPVARLATTALWPGLPPIWAPSLPGLRLPHLLRPPRLLRLPRLLRPRPPHPRPLKVRRSNS